MSEKGLGTMKSLEIRGKDIPVSMQIRLGGGHQGTRSEVFLERRGKMMTSHSLKKGKLYSKEKKEVKVRALDGYNSLAEAIVAGYKGPPL